jgi:hypothetical protein
MFLGKPLYLRILLCPPGTLVWPQPRTGLHLGVDCQLLHHFPLTLIWTGDQVLRCIFQAYQLLQKKIPEIIATIYRFSLPTQVC